MTADRSREDGLERQEYGPTAKSDPTAGAYNEAPAPQRCYETKARGLAVLNSPLLNKGTAFTAEERTALGLTGLLPPDISTLEAQVKRAYIQYERLPDALSKNIYLTALHDRNEVLFYRLFSEHLREMIPIVNDLTVGMAMEQYHHECRPPAGRVSLHRPCRRDRRRRSPTSAPDAAIST